MFTMFIFCQGKKHYKVTENNLKSLADEIIKDLKPFNDYENQLRQIAELPPIDKDDFLGVSFKSIKWCKWNGCDSWLYSFRST